MSLMRTCKLFLIAALAAFLLAPAAAREAQPWTAWQATLHTGHALAGKIWSGREKRFVDPSDLAKAVGAARFVLLGEVHDNPDAHRLQAWLIGAAAGAHKPAVVMEMITQTQAPALKDYLAKPGANAAGLGAALDWEARGWPAWEIYKPLAEEALARGLVIHAGDIDRATLKKIGRQGLGVLEAKRRQTLLLETPLGDKLRNALIDELYDSHCELMPKAALASAVHIQRLRDAVLADSLVAAAGTGAGILIAGNGHIRTDRAVPWYLKRRVADADVVSVMMLEVEAETKVAEDLVPMAPDGKPAVDYVWFTPRAEREDQCEKLRKHFGKQQ
ncbi:MAG: ChaN family lipoprotein [Hyphomicrobiales bacterium]|nr:ChaN family lipoprotein [Hyphomicrobiales bacterium]